MGLFRVDIGLTFYDVEELQVEAETEDDLDLAVQEALENMGIFWDDYEIVDFEEVTVGV